MSSQECNFRGVPLVNKCPTGYDTATPSVCVCIYFLGCDRSGFACYMLEVVFVGIVI